MATFFSLVAGDIGIDLGTINTLVYVDKKGIVINEPSVVAIDINNGDIVSVGKAAWDMIGKTPGNIVPMRPLEEGVISDYEITQVMLKYFIDKSSPGFSFLQSRVIVSIPSGITDVEKRAVEDAVFQSGARDVLLIEEPLASAVGAGLPADEPKGNMVINIGGGTTEVAVVSLNGMVSSRSIFIGGDLFNQLITEHVKEEYNLMIGYNTAERLKMTIGTVNPDHEEMKSEVSGRDLITGLPKTAIIRSTGITRVLLPSIVDIIDGIKSVLERTPPELSSDIIRDGILFTGGSSRLNGLAEWISRAINMKLILDDNPETSAVSGTGKLLKQFANLKKTRRLR
ncbi:MAG: rod shape-determining protein [Tissierellia bacterium]|nr:rod shape-determining protein [Tissierellia bacterium]